MTSTARASRTRASSGFSSSLTVSFHSLTEAGMYSRAVAEATYQRHAGLVQRAQRDLTFAKNALLRFDIVLELDGPHPDPHRLRQLLYRVGEDHFGVLVRLHKRANRMEESASRRAKEQVLPRYKRKGRTYVQLASAEPDILALGASLAALCDEFPRRDLLPGDVFEPSCGDPTWGMLRIGLGEGLQECTSTLDIAADNLLSRSETECAATIARKGGGAHPISVEVLSN